MRKLKTIALVSVFGFVSGTAFAAGGLEIKGGVASVKDAGDKIGFDGAIGYAIKPDRFFAVMPEVNFNWLSYAGSSASLGPAGSTGTTTPSANYYTLPVLLNGRFYIPMGTDDIPVFQPIVTVGAGYAWSSYVQTNPSWTERFTGFMYQATVGGLLNLGMIADGSASSTNILFEVGYRGGLLTDTGGRNANYAGFLGRVGVSFSF